MRFSGTLFLQEIQPAGQGVFFALFLLALGTSLGARTFRGEAVALFLWRASFLFFVLLWCLGLGTELYERGQSVPLRSLLLAIAAFSILSGAIFSLVMEWFERPGALHTPRVIWSLGILWLVGWYFGDLALTQNRLFALGSSPASGDAIWPEGWVLAVSGAQLLGVARLVQSPHEPFLRVLNPVPATLWILAFCVFLLWAKGAGSQASASVFWAASGPFLFGLWRARHPQTRRARLAGWLVWGGILVVLWGASWRVSGWDLALERWTQPLACAVFALFW